MMAGPRLTKLELQITESLWTCGSASIRGMHGYLKQGIVRIMTQGFAAKLNFGRKLLLSIAIASLAGTLVFGLIQSPRSWAQSAAVGASSISTTFDVASIKPDHKDGHSTRISYDKNSFLASGATLKRLIGFAYNMNEFQLSGGPDWLDSETFEVQAKMDQSTAEALNKIPREQLAEQRRIMLQLLLADRFNLKLSHSSKELPVYVLVLTKNGPRFSPSPPSSGGQTGFWNHNSDLKANGVAIDGFADWLSRIVGRKVVNKTELQGKYDFTLKWTPERLDTGPGGPAGSPALDSPSPDFGPSIFAALQEQLGLKLEPQKALVDALIVESVQKPSPN